MSSEELKAMLRSAIGDYDVHKVRSLMSSVTPDNAPSLHMALNFDDAWFPGKGYDRILNMMANNKFIDVNEVKDGKTALTAIAEACHNSTDVYAGMVTTLLAQGADATILDSNGWSALAYVINKNNVSPQIIQALIDAGSDVNLIVHSEDFMGVDHRSILGMAYYNGKSFFKQLKEKGATMTQDEIMELESRNYPLEPA